MLKSLKEGIKEAKGILCGMAIVFAFFVGLGTGCYLSFGQEFRDVRISDGRVYQSAIVDHRHHTVIAIPGVEVYRSSDGLRAKYTPMQRGQQYHDLAATPDQVSLYEAAFPRDCDNQ